MGREKEIDRYRDRQRETARDRESKEKDVL